MASSHTPSLDPRFDPLRTALSGIGSLDPAMPEGHSQAAVSVVLRSRDELEVLLIKRAQSSSDPWSGHMALPGGKREPSDVSLLHTAVRETLEETGVSLSTTEPHLGRLSRVDPATRRLPPLTITPFVFGVPGDTVAKAASGEVEKVFWIPLPAFRDVAAAAIFQYRVGGVIRSFTAFNVRSQVVWGLTYRVLEEFLKRTGGSSRIP